jgi:hypothetical protein
MFCPSCGKQVSDNDNFCPNCAKPLHATTAQFNSAHTPNAPLPQSPTTTSKKRPKTGLIITVLGAIVIFLSAVIYLISGNATVGIVGIVLVIITGIFLRNGQTSTKPKTKQFGGIIPMFIGFIIMILVGTAMSFDLGVLIGGLLLAIGGATISAGK